MPRKVQMLFLVIAILFSLSNFVYSSSVILENQKDVFYPPSEALLKQGMTLESYKAS